MKKACTFIGDTLESMPFGYDYEDPGCISMKLQISQYILNAYKSGVKLFYSICEQGIDLWAAEIVTYLMDVDKEVELRCVLPYEEQAARWYPEMHELYYRILARATKTVMIGSRYSSSCYESARKMTVDNSTSIMVVLPAGKSNCIVEYAKKQHKDMIFAC